MADFEDSTAPTWANVLAGQDASAALAIGRFGAVVWTIWPMRLASSAAAKAAMERLTQTGRRLTAADQTAALTAALAEPETAARIRTGRLILLRPARDLGHRLVQRLVDAGNLLVRFRQRLRGPPHRPASLVRRRRRLPRGLRSSSS